jgi:DNA ligase-1
MINLAQSLGEDLITVIRIRTKLYINEREIVIMRYEELVSFYEKIESTSSRILMTDHLVSLFKNSSEEDIDKIVYLTEGKLYPSFVGIELGMAEKSALKALSVSTGISQDKVEEEYNKKGDIGIIAEILLKKRVQATLFKRKLSVEDVYKDLDKIARTSGSGSSDTKIRILSGLLSDANPKEAKYIMRIVTGKMRLGVADNTMIVALSQAFAHGQKDKVEGMYNVTSDIGEVARVLKKTGVAGIKTAASVGRPIRMMLAQRLSSVQEIVAQMGRFACEFKYDGMRLQIHKNGNDISIFTRNLEHITDQYPDVVKYALHNIKVNSAIVEGECVTVDPAGYMLPFQELMHRRRKYEIDNKAIEYPVHLYLFDVLLVDKQDIMDRPLIERRNILKNSISETENFRLSHTIISDNVSEIEKFFESSIENGCEGLMCKDLNSTYQAGSRGMSWVKLKRSYQSKMVEPIDVVIVGAFLGRGRRSGTYGALLVAVYDQEKDIFSTICKVGSGFSDEELNSLPDALNDFRLERKSVRVESIINADVWFEPKLVIEIIGDELTLSPTHPCAMDSIRKNAGIAMRFPRFLHKWRYDKGPEDATTVSEIVDIYKSQLKKLD